MLVYLEFRIKFPKLLNKAGKAEKFNQIFVDLDTTVKYMGPEKRL